MFKVQRVLMVFSGFLRFLRVFFLFRVYWSVVESLGFKIKSFALWRFRI